MRDSGGSRQVWTYKSSKRPDRSESTVVHPRHLTPANSILAYGIAAFALAASGSFVWLAVLSVLTRLLLCLACIASMPAVRRQAGGNPRMRLPGGWTLPLLAVTVCLGLLAQVEWRAVLAIAALLGTGSLLFATARRCDGER